MTRVHQLSQILENQLTLANIEGFEITEEKDRIIVSLGDIMEIYFVVKVMKEYLMQNHFCINYKYIKRFENIIDDNLNKKVKGYYSFCIKDKFYIYPLVYDFLHLPLGSPNGSVFLGKKEHLLESPDISSFYCYQFLKYIKL